MAVILESFKINRAKQVFRQEVTEKKALLAAFHCLDAQKKGTLTRGEFEELVHFLYTDTSSINIMIELFDLIDEDGSSELDQLEFFRLSDAITYVDRHATLHLKDISDTLEQNIGRLQRGKNGSNSSNSIHRRSSSFGKSSIASKNTCCYKYFCIIPLITWLEYRLCCQKRISLARLIFSNAFEAFIMIVVVVNSVFIGISMIGSNGEELKSISIFSYIFLGIYIIEAFLKVTAIGFHKYWRDSWNKFDFLLVFVGVVALLVQLLVVNTSSNIILGVSNQQNTDMARFGRSAKLLRTLRFARGLRVLRLTRIFSQLSKLFARIKNFMVRFGVVWSSTRNAFATMFIIIWIYGIFGYFFFRGVVPRYITTNVTATATTNSTLQYSYQGNLNTPGDAFVAFFWIALQHNWSDLMFNVLNNMQSSSSSTILIVHLFFISAHFILAIVIASLCVGIVWEVFVILGSTGVGNINVRKNISKKSLFTTETNDDVNNSNPSFAGIANVTLGNIKFMKNLDNVQNREHSVEALNALKECQQTDKKLFLNHIPKAELMKMELEALEDFASVLGMDLHEVYSIHYLKQERRTDRRNSMRPTKENNEYKEKSQCLKVCVRSIEFSSEGIPCSRKDTKEKNKTESSKAQDTKQQDTKQKDVKVRVSTLFPMGTPREIHSTSSKQKFPYLWNEWLIFSDDVSGLVGIDALEIRVHSVSGRFNRAHDVGSILLSIKELSKEADLNKKKRVRKWYPLLSTKINNGTAIEYKTGRIDLQFVFKDRSQSKRFEWESSSEDEEEEQKDLDDDASKLVDVLLASQPRDDHAGKKQSKTSWQKLLLTEMVNNSTNPTTIELPNLIDSDHNEGNSELDSYEDNESSSEDENRDEEYTNTTPRSNLNLSDIL